MLPHRLSVNAPAPTDVSTLSLHDALPISAVAGDPGRRGQRDDAAALPELAGERLVHPQRGEDVDGEEVVPAVRGHVGEQFVAQEDRKSTRLNSSHVKISYAVLCLKQRIRP